MDSTFSGPWWHTLPSTSTCLEGPRARRRHSQESYSAPEVTARHGLLISNPMLQVFLVFGDVTMALPRQDVALVQQGNSNGTQLQGGRGITAMQYNLLHTPVHA